MKLLPAFLVTLLLAVPFAHGAPDEVRTPFAESIGTVPASAMPTVHTLAAPETQAATLDFSVALRLRNSARLKESVARGGTLSPDELDRTYLPTLKDYETTRQWLQSQGFTIVQEDPSRLSVFARGTAAQIEKSLQTRLVGLTVKGVKYVAADTAPSLPVSVAAPVLGINGLQPYRRLHKHAIVRPAATASVTYKVSDILAAYDAKNLGVTGKNQTIAILIDTTPAASDLTRFWTANSVAQTTANVTTINVNNATLGAPGGEETLDVEWTSGIAPGAKIRVYATGTLDDTSLDKGLARILADVGTDPTIHQLSISLGLGESYESASQFTTDAQYFAALASRGVSTFVSSGDGGSTPDDTGTGNEDTGPLQVEYYASDPSVTGVGGTTLHVNTTTGARASETAWSGSGGGVSIQFAKPVWQTGTGVPAGSRRFVPDVALPADPYTGAYVYLDGSAQTIGGTSWAAPTWAGFCALVNEARANAGQTGGLGLLNPALYPLIGTNNFHDITTGNNAEGSKANGKYPTTAGYDEVTGIGTPDVAVLLKTLASRSATPTPSPTPTPTPAPTATPPAASLVISQIYGGGGGNGATYANDFIELFNPTTTAVDLGAYSVQYTSATGTTWSVTKLKGNLAAGHYFLISEKGGGSGPALPTSDASGSIALSATAGKVALVSMQTAIKNHTSAGVVDFVGYGTSANEHEGTGPAPAPSATKADLRAGNGRTDTNDNAADFTTGAPVPRNSQSPPAK